MSIATNSLHIVDTMTILKTSFFLILIGCQDILTVPALSLCSVFSQPTYNYILCKMHFQEKLSQNDISSCIADKN